MHLISDRKNSLKFQNNLALLIKYLNLSMNRIHTIDEHVYDDLENLICLNLSNSYLN